jgi:hypothetical protein
VFYLVKVASALVSRAEGLTVGDFLAQWLAHIRGRVRPRTFGGYESLLRINAIPSLGPILLAELGPLQLQSLYAELLLPDRASPPGPS